MEGRKFFAALVTLVSFSGVTAEGTAALVFARGDRPLNANPPGLELGWSGACRRGGLSAVHLGEGWILSAAHVGMGTVLVGDEEFPPIAGSEVVFHDADGPASDLILFRVGGAPSGPRIPISSAPVATGDRVVLMGNGKVQAEPRSWRGRGGYRLGPSRGLLWGENLVVIDDHELELGSRLTRTFGVELDDFYALPSEAIAAAGDSGGPVFRNSEAGWELVGILVATSQAEGQPENSIFFGSLSFAADLSVYRDEINAARGAPAAGPCGRGFAEAACFVVAWPIWRRGLLRRFAA